MSNLVVGTCGLCGGPVQVPAVWMAIIPPTPTCAHCGAVAAEHGPVMEMRRPAPRYYEYTTAAGTTRIEYDDNGVYAQSAPFSWG